MRGRLLYCSALFVRAGGRPISRRLQLEQPRIALPGCKQFGMRADLLDASAFEYEDAVSHAHGRKPVRDQDRGLAG